MKIKRKLFGYGYSRLLCLPKFWVDEQHLNRGDYVYLEITKKGDILITPK